MMADADGEHMLLRSDLHKLFNEGLVTVTPALRVHDKTQVQSFNVKDDKSQ